MDTGRVKLVPIRVECHSGYRADEYPQCFFRNDDGYEVREITDRWYQSDRDPGIQLFKDY
jgi:hypothetical protein